MIIIIPSVLWGAVVGCWIAGAVKGIRDRRLDREARERRDRQDARLKDVEDAMLARGKRP